uniref:CFA20 domain-containing protein n=1 Tax=Glossina austeni TaxID=7395 RepID=A0A1A9V1F6_GLOAU
MFKNTFQSGFLSILYSIGSKPLQIWDKKVRNGHIKRITDNDIQSLVLEIVGTNVSTTFITCPADPKKTLGIKLPFLVMIIKNMKKYFTFEVQVLDDKNVRRRFRASNYQSTTRVKPFICTMPMRLDEGWNQIQFNLLDFTRRAYGTNYVETLRIWTSGVVAHHSFAFLWCGSSEGLGMDCLKIWDFRRCEDICCIRMNINKPGRFKQLAPKASVPRDNA